MKTHKLLHFPVKEYSTSLFRKQEELRMTITSELAVLMNTYMM